MLIYDTGPAGSTTREQSIWRFQHWDKSSDSVSRAHFNHNQQTGASSTRCALLWHPLFGRIARQTPTRTFLGKAMAVSVWWDRSITNTLAIMQADPTHVQSVTYHGTPCSATINQGDIIVSDLTLKGNTSITMNLVPYGFMNIRQVALVAGGPHP